MHMAASGGNPSLRPPGSIGSGSNAYPPEYPLWFIGPGTSMPLTNGILRESISQVGVGYQAPWGSVKGISMLASFPGGSQGVDHGPTFNFFWESDNCADGDTEYGFTLSQVGGAQITTFYYSYWSNCGNPSVPTPPYSDSCWAIVYFPGINMLAWEPVVQCGGGVNMPVSVQPSSSYYYNAYPYRNQSTGAWNFMAQVKDLAGNTLESCSVDPANGANTSCWPASASGVVTNQTAYGSCTFNPATSTTQFNTSTYFNPQWTYGVGGWVFAVIDGSSGSPYLNNNMAPVTISSIRVGQ